MKILAIEFSSARRNVAIVVDGVVRGRAEQTGGRTTRALALVEQALQEAGLEREAVECIALGLGPGSYTGIRVAISLAQGWQLARGVRLLGLSTVECLAAQAQAAGIRGRVNVLIDAQRDEYYFAAFDVSAAERRQLEPLRIVTAGEARHGTESGELILWPELQKAFPRGRVLWPDAGALAQLADSREDSFPGELLEPIYLREATFAKAPPPREISPG